MSIKFTLDENYNLTLKPNHSVELEPTEAIAVALIKIIGELESLNEALHPIEGLRVALKQTPSGDNYVPVERED